MNQRKKFKEKKHTQSRREYVQHIDIHVRQLTGQGAKISTRGEKERQDLEG